jgi:hypothetical protein
MDLHGLSIEPSPASSSFSPKRSDWLSFWSLFLSIPKRMFASRLFPLRLPFPSLGPTCCPFRKDLGANPDTTPQGALLVARFPEWKTVDCYRRHMSTATTTGEPSDWKRKIVGERSRYYWMHISKRMFVHYVDYDIDYMQYTRMIKDSQHAIPRPESPMTVGIVPGSLTRGSVCVFFQHKVESTFTVSLVRNVREGGVVRLLHL